MLAFARAGSRWGAEAPSVTALVAKESAEGCQNAEWVASLNRSLTESVEAIRNYLDAAGQQGLRVGGMALHHARRLCCAAPM